MGQHFTCDYCGAETELAGLYEISIVKQEIIEHNSPNAMRALDLCPSCMVRIKTKLIEREV